MKESYRQLSYCPLFQGIREEDIPGLLECMGATERRAAAGQYLFREGDRAEFIGIVLSGSVQVIREDYDGNRSIMANIGPNQLFGESYSLSGDAMLPVSIQADEDCRVLLLDSRRISVCCSNACAFHSRLIQNLLHVVAAKNRLLHQKLRITSRRTTREKLMEYLRSQAKLRGQATFTIPFDRQELADYLEVDRTGLSAEISKLRREGLLECEKSTFRLLSNIPHPH